jgi:hypothetical protein
MERIRLICRRADEAIHDFDEPWHDGTGSVGAGLMELVCAILRNEPLAVQAGTSLAYYLMLNYGFDAFHFVWDYVDHEAISRG